LLFCIAEEVLSRGITNLVNSGQLSVINGTRQVAAPSHVLYADDVLIFCKGTSSNIQVLSQLFANYAQISGQCVNPQKSTIYSGSISYNRLLRISQALGFNIGTFPFTYLGVPIFKGRPKVAYFQPVADKIKAKLSAWKASLLSIAGRVELIKSVIQSMLVYSLTIYSWPVSLIKDLEKKFRNFIWSGDLNARKLVTVSWHKICHPFKEGGLGLRSISDMNEAANLKLAWDLLFENSLWAKFLRSRAIRIDKAISHHIFSSLWSGIKNKLQTIWDNSCWVLVKAITSISGSMIGVVKS
jgi:hypothetical protein